MNIYLFPSIAISKTSLIKYPVEITLWSETCAGTFGSYNKITVYFTLGS